MSSRFRGSGKEGEGRDVFVNQLRSTDRIKVVLLIIFVEF